MTTLRWSASFRRSRRSSSTTGTMQRSRSYTRYLCLHRELLQSNSSSFRHPLYQPDPEGAKSSLILSIFLGEKISELARRPPASIRGDDDADLEQWVEDASSSELASLAQGIGRDTAAVRPAIPYPWSTSSVKERRQTYGHSG